MSLQDLLAQRAAIEAEIQRLQSESRGQAIAKIKAIMAEHGLTAADISGRVSPATETSGAGKKGPKAGGTVAPKYRNQASGETWTGRGLQPKWLKAAIEGGAKIEDFLIV